MQIEKSFVNVDEGKTSPLVNGQHLSSPSSSNSSEQSGSGDSGDPGSKNDSEVPPDPILRSFSLSEEKLSHIQIAKVSFLYNFNSFLEQF